MADVGYAQLYKLQLIFAELDNSSNPKETILNYFEDKPSQDAAMWLYEHRKPSVSGESRDATVDLETLDLQAETASLYADTKALKLDGSALDAREALAVNKLQMELLGKILELHEKSKRHRQIGEFIDYVFEILTEEQKEKVLVDFGETYSSKSNF